MARHNNKEKYKFNREPKEQTGIMVTRLRDKDGNLEPMEKMIKRFRKKVIKDGVLREYIQNTYYLSPGEQKRRDKKECISRIKYEEKVRQREEEKYIKKGGK